MGHGVIVHLIADLTLLGSPYLWSFPKLSSNNWTGYTSFFTSSPLVTFVAQLLLSRIPLFDFYFSKLVSRKLLYLENYGFHKYHIGLQTAGIILCVCWGPSSSQTKGTSRKSLPFQSLSKGREGWIWTGRNKDITFTGHRHHFPAEMIPCMIMAYFQDGNNANIKSDSIKWCQIAEKISHNFAPHSCRCGVQEYLFILFPSLGGQLKIRS